MAKQLCNLYYSTVTLEYQIEGGGGTLQLQFFRFFHGRGQLLSTPFYIVLIGGQLRNLYKICWGTVTMPPVYSVLQSNELNKTAALIRYRLFILSPSNDTTAESKRSTLL